MTSFPEARYVYDVWAWITDEDGRRWAKLETFSNYQHAVNLVAEWERNNVSIATIETRRVEVAS